MLPKLAIVSTHPIQYFAPVFKLLAAKCEFRVFYTWGLGGEAEKLDKDFGKTFKWDIPLLDGYEYEFLKNTAKDPGSHHFMGIRNSDIIDRISAFKPDAILVYGWAYLSHLKVMRHFNGKTPIWFRGDSTLLDEKPIWKKMLRKAMLSWVYSFVDTAFYVGRENKAYYHAFGLKEDQLLFAPHAVDNDRFAESRKKEVDELRTTLNVKPEEILILFAGKFEEKKNPFLLLDTFIEFERLRVTSNELRDRAHDSQPTTRNPQPKIHLLFVGNGALEESLKLKVERLKEVGSRKSEVGHFQKTNIHFMDFQNQRQMPVIYQACDLFCLPSKSETWGLAVNEAMAAGKAVLVSNKVGCSSDLVDASNGAIFKHGDIESLIKNLEALTEDKSSLKERGLRSTIKIKDWSFENQTEAIFNKLSNLYSE